MHILKWMASLDTLGNGLDSTPSMSFFKAIIVCSIVYNHLHFMIKKVDEQSLKFF